MAESTALPLSIAQTIFQHLENAAQSQPTVTLALPGGRSPGPIVNALASMLDDDLRQKLHIFWVDERVQPAGHADRNDHSVLKAWSDGGPLPVHVHAMVNNVDRPQEDAAQYRDLLHQYCVNGQLDVCLLGMGEDGHIASLFPNHVGLGEQESVFVVTDSPKPPPLRLTLSLPMLSQAQHRILLAFGADKGKVVGRIRQDERGPIFPASMLPIEGTQWFLDDAAEEAAAKVMAG